MNTKVYKWCIVPECNNTSRKSPDKLFVYVPHNKRMRIKWLKLARRDPTTIRLNSPIYFCEDHFDLPNDMENYMEYHVMGTVSQIRMKPGCLPRKYACQLDRKKRTSDITRPYMIKKQRKMAIEECEKDYEKKNATIKQNSPNETISDNVDLSNLRKHEPEPQPVPRVSKKNKDATGTKIKRSKKKLEDPSTSTITIENVISLQKDKPVEPSDAVPKKSSSDNFITNFSIDAHRADCDDEEAKMDVESFIRDNDPLQSDINLQFISNLDNTSRPCEANSPKPEEIYTEDSLNFASAAADIVRIENAIPAEPCVDSLSFKVEVVKEDCDSSQDAVVDDAEVKDSSALNQIDLSEPVIQKVFFGSAQRKGIDFQSELNTEDVAEVKIEPECIEDEQNENDVVDQTGKLNVCTSIVKETDSSFDARIKELEERALKKFKGSFLDNIF